MEPYPAVFIKRWIDPIGTKRPKVTQENLPDTVTPTATAPWGTDTRQDGSRCSCSNPVEYLNVEQKSNFITPANVFQSSVVQFWCEQVSLMMPVTCICCSFEVRYKVITGLSQVFLVHPKRKRLAAVDIFEMRDYQIQTQAACLRDSLIKSTMFLNSKNYSD